MKPIKRVKQYTLRGRQRGRNQFLVAIHGEDGAHWRMWTDTDKNPTLDQLRADLVDALHTLDRMIGTEARQRQEGT